MSIKQRKLTIRLSEDEFQQIRSEAEHLGLSKQAYVLGAVFNAVIIPAKEAKEICLRFAECNRQLRGLATNVNQMAHIANIYSMDKIKKLPEEYILLDLRQQLEDYKQEAEKVWQSIKSLITLQKHTGV